MTAAVVSVEIDELRWTWAGGALIAVHFGDETVAFHDATASTHVFDKDTYRLVETLRQVDSNVSASVLWTNAFGVSPSESDYEALDQSLETLVRAGLAANPS